MTVALQLFSTLIIRPLRLDLLRTVLTILGVALGVGVVIGIDLAGDAATGSFESSLATVAGKADLEIIANGGIDERILATLTALPINARFAPVLEVQAKIPGAGFTPIYGIDPFSADSQLQNPSEPPTPQLPAIFLSKALADRIHASKNTRLTLADTEFQVAAIIPSTTADFAIVDIADFQQTWKALGRLDRIDITLDPAQKFDDAERQIRASIPTGYELAKPGTRGSENQRMLRAFRWNLRFLSYISLVVGAFLIYNTISISVVRRRAEIGILRALGTSESGIFFLFLGEALFLGLAGSILGLLLGRAMAEGAVGLISQTVSALYTSSRPGPIAFTPATIFEAILAGAIIAILSAAGPAREAMAVTPSEAMRRGGHERVAHSHFRRNLLLALACVCIAYLTSQAGPVDGRPLWGYASTLFSIAAAALLSPVVVVGISVGLRGFTRRLFQGEGLLAGRSLTASLSRTSVVVGALATAVAIMLSVAIMVGSFRETVVLWLDTQLRADIYVGPASNAGAGAAQPLPREVPDIAAKLPGVAAIDVLHSLEIHYDQDRSNLGGVDTDVLRRYGHLRFLDGAGARERILKSLPNQDRAIISEPFAYKHHLRTGDAFLLDLGTHHVSFRVAGVYYDYTSERGFVMLDRSTLLKYLPDQPPSNLAVYLASGSNVADVQNRLRTALAEYPVNIAPNEALRKGAMTIFDRTFAITWALEAVAILVAMLGAANSLLALVLDRRRDLGLLQYLGAAAGQIQRMILIEAGLIGLMACTLGLALGSALSLLLTYVINRQSFGWTIQFHPPLTLVGASLLLVWSFTVLAGLYPARVASRLNPIETLQEE